MSGVVIWKQLPGWEQVVGTGKLLTTLDHDILRMKQKESTGKLNPTLGVRLHPKWRK